MKPFALVLLMLLAACAPKPPELPPRLLAPQKTPAKVAPSLATPTPGPTTRAFDESLLSGKEFLLEVQPSVIAVRDIGLGPLEPGELADAVSVLFAAVERGGEKPLDARLVDPRWAAYLQGWARRMNSEGLSGIVRVGTALPEKDGVMVPVRVLGEKKEWQGWVYLKKSEGVWLVGDAQVEGRERDVQPFDPESPRGR